MIEHLDNKEFIYDVVEFAYRFPKPNFTDYELFDFGLDVALVANKANYLAGKSRNYSRKLQKRFENLIIKSVDELAFSQNQILTLAKDYPIEKVYQLIDDVLKQILTNQLINDEDQIKIYCINALKKTDDNISDVDISSDNEYEYLDEHQYQPKDVHDEVVMDESFELPVEKIEELASAASESELEENLFEQGQVVKTFTEMKINQLEKRLMEQERLLREKDERLYHLEKQALQQRLNSDIDRIVQQNLENLRELNYLDTTYSEKIMLGRELQKVYRQFVSSIDTKYREILSEENDEKEED